jgi:hypothetical protein
VGVLQEFERRLEGAVEGFFARAFRSGLQPIELAKALQRYIADNQHVSAEGVVVPNVFRVQVSTKDHERLSQLGASLPRELAEVVARTATERGLLLRGPSKVRIDVDASIKIGRYKVQGRVEAVDAALAASARGRAAGGDAGIDRTQIVTTAPAGPLRAVVRDGPSAGASLALSGARISVGRLAPSDLALEDPTVSREHAAFVRRGEQWWVVDLGSTNGTRVNGRRTGERQVGAGDVVEFGSIAVELVES